MLCTANACTFQVLGLYVIKSLCSLLKVTELPVFSTASTMSVSKINILSFTCADVRA